MAKPVRLISKADGSYREFNSQTDLARWLGVSEKLVRTGGPTVLKQTHYIAEVPNKDRIKYVQDVLDTASELVERMTEAHVEKHYNHIFKRNLQMETFW